MKWEAGVVPIELEIISPEETIRDGGKKYMFSCEDRQAGKDSPYILVKAEVKNPDGTSRPLSAFEFNNVKITYTSSADSNQNVLWKLISFLTGQDLNFIIKKGEEISTFKMFLSGFSTTSVRPNNSILNISLMTKMPNGIVGRGDGIISVSVKPVWFGAYIWRLVTAVLIIGVIVLFIVLEIRKPRFSRKMYPNVVSDIKENGREYKPIGIPYSWNREIRYRIWPPLKAEERSLTIKCTEYLDQQIVFTCKAVGGGSFIIKDIQNFEPYKGKVTFTGVSYEEMVKRNLFLNLKSTIQIRIEEPRVYGKIVMQFIKSDKRNFEKRDFKA